MTAPPDFSGWLAFCQNCDKDRTVNRHDQRDVATGELYHEYTCAECQTALLTIMRANPAERETTDWQDLIRSQPNDTRGLRRSR